LDGNEGTAKLLAGGTDIIPGFQQELKRFAGIKQLIDIGGVDELKEIKWNKNHLEIGANSTFTDIAENEEVNKDFPLLSKAVSSIGSKQIRNRASIAGNFVNNAPCADSVPPLLVYDALIEVRNNKEVKEHLLKDFLMKPYSTQLNPDEIVTKIRLPKQGSNYNGDFVKLGRRRGVSISRITLAVLMSTQDY
jgi:CO/xanthine dehydrogenase FAD-binding subunit